MIRSGVVTVAFFVALHLAGCTRFVGVLSGTLEGGRWGLFLGLLSAVSWFAAVTLAPVLVLAGAAERIVRWRLAGNRSAARS